MYLQLMNRVWLDSIASSETDLRVFKPWKWRHDGAVYLSRGIYYIQVKNGQYYCINKVGNIFFHGIYTFIDH